MGEIVKCLTHDREFNKCYWKVPQKAETAVLHFVEGRYKIVLPIIVNSRCWDIPMSAYVPNVS